MTYNQYTLNGVKINIIKDDISNLRLIQSKTKYPLSQFFIDGKKPKAIINCSYFTNEYVIGRNQGDLLQNTSSFTDKGWLGFALKDDLSYAAGPLEWWDVEKSICGFTPAVICIKDGKSVSMITKELASSYAYKMGLATGVTFFGILNNKKVCLLITAEKGLSGYQVLEYLNKSFTFDFLCELDGGGSTEMIVDGTIKQKSTDGTERKMFNGLAFVEPNEDIDIDLMCPTEEGGATQAFTLTHFGIDIGWYKKPNCDIYAAADGEVVFSGIYPQVIGGVSYKPIGVIIKHNLGFAFDYYSLYWHLDSTKVAKGDKVVKGQVIGIRGNTGKSGGVHLHFQTFRLPKGTELPSYEQWGKYSFDPVPYLTVYDNKQSFRDNEIITLKHVVEKPIDEIQALKEDIANKDKTIATLKEMNNTLDAAYKSLLEGRDALIEENKRLKGIFEEVRGIVNERNYI